MPHYYIQLPHSSEVRDAFWVLRGRVLDRVDVRSTLSRHRLKPDAEAISELQRIYPGSIFYELTLGPGQYFPCMARPSASNEHGPGANPEKSQKVADARASTTGQLHALNQQLEQICRVIQPKGRNLRSYGHEIRNVLILASTEVEALWKSTLKANGTGGGNTRDYVKLLTAMKLDQYRVSFPYYPWLPAIKPFGEWDSACPTLSLEWYDAYNQVKHDRESNFRKANLLHAFQAVAAHFVMLCAHHGSDFALTGDAALRAFHRLVEWPRWSPTEIYVPPFTGKYMPVHYEFVT
ncbi:MAG TPA: hypothetical protein VEK73_16350 [Xanthobacteraceae bacterium]|nr:hypothetical protein [Xanthobacteraceae bacterium]